MSHLAICRRRACLPSGLASCLRHRLFAAKLSTIVPPQKSHLEILDQRFPTDDFTNVTPAIISKTPLRLHLKPSHPLSTLRELIESAYPDFTHAYYVNRDMMLRTHTSTHEVEMFRKGETKWLLTADVYRRDEIDSSHYPIFHQVEGARIFSADAKGMKEVQEDNERLSSLLASANIVIEDVPHVSPTNPVQPDHDPEFSELVAKNLKLSLNNLMLKIFSEAAGISKEHPLRVRWIEAYFPFTSPSFEVEVFFQGNWLEILGSGVVRQATLNTAGVPNKIGWAFGLGLERIAMILFSIPDIRLFWSTDSRFLSQFEQGKINAFQPYSKYPSCFKDVSFWVSQDNSLHENDFCDLVRDTAGDLVEDVKRIDHFIHPKTNRTSLCYRINYRSMDRSLSNEEVNQVQNQVISRLKEQFAVEIR
ncbi:hypothetical protein BDZ97DRAFT_2005612 [Flammula alnicola]|nr:hypothetical protein BDZ97DRAFT_2005612 [Flammula alnicola]